jgi:hypothetical protein
LTRPSDPDSDLDQSHTPARARTLTPTLTWSPTTTQLLNPTTNPDPQPAEANSNHAPEHPSDLLAIVGFEAGGAGMQTFVCVDAVVVLAGAVLTSYVGVIGLLFKILLK